MVPKLRDNLEIAEGLVPFDGDTIDQALSDDDHHRTLRSRQGQEYGAGAIARLRVVARIVCPAGRLRGCARCR